MAELAGERVLSIQSHVVFGYVGGKAAVFPLQCLGYDVDVINTVNFSNHSGYGRFGGTKSTAAELEAIFKSMEMNELLVPQRLLTGYIPGAEGLSAVAGLVRRIKAEKPNLIYLLDPVLGDSGRLYVAADVIPIYRNLLPLSTIISPNWFEVETLTQTQLNSIPSLQTALKLLHEQYQVPNVVISSIPLKPWLLSALPQSIQPPPDSDYLLCISSSSSTDPISPTSQVHTQCVPLISGYFSGVGDLFSALLLAHYIPHHTSPPDHPEETPLSYAASYALTKTHAVLERTNEFACTLPEEERQSTDDEKDHAEPLRQTRRMRGRELRLIQSQDIIRGDGIGEPRRMECWKGFWDLH
ncbi:Ribokinase-like protein [Pluteus cervinus]|uniref:Ribokinase-like protein n=1 Tax=Pluteus cervinus TaxID=181527 RepID=A0ACD3BBM1_9AGAR|nr:Ribokinase-like protein [Pluteus cervinus]